MFRQYIRLWIGLTMLALMLSIGSSTTDLLMAAPAETDHPQSVPGKHGPSVPLVTDTPTRSNTPTNTATSPPTNTPLSTHTVTLTLTGTNTPTDTPTPASTPYQCELCGPRNFVINQTTCNCTLYPINSATGNFWHSFFDFDIPGRGPTLQLDRTYNSEAASENGPLGYGWTHNYNMFITGSTPTPTAQGLLVGHVSWQNRSAGTPRYQLPITITIQSAMASVEYPSMTTDANGFFTVSLGTLPGGVYQWRVKGPNGGPGGNTTPGFLSKVGTLTLSGSAVTNVEMGLMKAGDANNNDVVNSQDFTILKNTFGRSSGQQGYDARADFNGDNTVNAVDFTILKNNFGQAGASISAPPITFVDPIVHQENGSTAAFYGPGLAYTHDPKVLAELVHNPDGTYTFTHTQGLTSYTFNTVGKLSAITDHNGYTTSLTYTNGLLTRVTEPAGRTLTLAYTNGLLTGVTDLASRSVSFAYTNGELTSATDVAGNATHFTYDGSHRMLTMTDANGGVVTNVYDGSGRTVRQTDPMGRTFQLAYANTSITNTTTITDPRNNVTVHDYINNRIVRVVRNPGTTQPATWRFTWGAGYPSGLATFTDPNNHTTSNIWDANGNLLSTTDPLGRTNSYAYNSTNNLIAMTDTLGVTNTFAYDANGNLLTASRPLTQTNQLATTSFGYDPAHPGDVLTSTNPLGKSWRFAYDAYGNRISSTNPLTETTRYSYDTIGRVLSVTSPRNYTATITYNPYGDPTRITDTLGYPTTYTYDRNRNLKTLTDANSHVMTYTYDLDNEYTRVMRPDGTHSDYGYDANGNVISQTNGMTQTTTYSYDSFDRLIGTTDPLTRTTVYTYDIAGRLTDMRDAQGQTTGYGYDNADQLLNILYGDGTTHNVTYTYDPLSRRMSMADGTGTTTYAYDSLNRLTRSQNGAGKTVGYGYDLDNRLTTLNYPDASGSATLAVTRGYDAADRLTSVSDWLNHTSTFSHDQDGDLTGITYPNNVLASLGYDGADRVTSITHSLNSSPFLSFNYGRDGLGLLISADEGAAGIHDYSYDALDRLTGDQHQGGGSPISRTWAYDGAYEITQTGYRPGSSTPTTTTRSYDAANELRSLVEMVGSTTSKNLSLNYDVRGNRISKSDSVSGQMTNYAYDQANRLTSISAVAQYAYNGDGLRMSKTRSITENFTWDVSGGSVPMLLQDGSASYVYGPGGMLLEEVTNGGQAYYYHTDQLGSVRALTNAAGQVVNTYNYDPYGATISSTGSLTNPFGYAGEYADAESGLIYLRARYYDPATQQFLTRDPLVAETEEAYVYASSNPLNLIDPAGTADTENEGDAEKIANEVDRQADEQTNPNTKQQMKDFAAAVRTAIKDKTFYKIETCRLDDKGAISGSGNHYVRKLYLKDKKGQPIKGPDGKPKPDKTADYRVKK